MQLNDYGKIVGFSLSELIKDLLDMVRQAAVEQEVPVASLVCESFDDFPLRHGNGNEPHLQDNRLYRVLGRASNRICHNTDVTAHSEILALRKACRVKKSERLPSCMMITTLEPCLMCSGAIVLARLATVYYLAPTQKGPGMTWLLRQLHQQSNSDHNPSKDVIAAQDSQPRLNHHPALVHLRDREKEYQKILRSFFHQRRRTK